jgi:hypothetical protein
MYLINSEIGEALIQFVQNNPLSTVDVMRNYLLSVCGVNVSKTVISDWLDGQCLTLKLVRDVLEDRNSLQTKETRFAYAKWMLESELRENCVYIDESGFNVWTKRSYGRSSKGSRCFRVCNGQRGKNISLCMAISSQGVLHSKLLIGAFNRELYTEFLIELSETLAGSQFVFIMDNCRIHHEINLDRDEHHIKFLPPYSPFLNPIEAAFSVLKAEVKGRMNAPGGHIGFTYPQRRETLLNIISGSLEVVTPHKCLSFFRHSSSFLAKCIEKVDILGD